MLVTIGFGAFVLQAIVSWLRLFLTVTWLGVQCAGLVLCGAIRVSSEYVRMHSNTVLICIGCALDNDV